jgi:hypothetical protein
VHVYRVSTYEQKFRGLRDPEEFFVPATHSGAARSSVYLSEKTVIAMFVARPGEVALVNRSSWDRLTAPTTDCKEVSGS